MRIYTEAVGAGDFIITPRGSFLALMLCAQPVTIYFYDGTNEIGRWESVSTGKYGSLKDEEGRSLKFTSAKITSAAAQNITIGVGFGEVGDNAISGTVSLAQGSNITNVAPATVGTAEVNIVAASSGRKAVRFYSPLTNTGNIALGATGITLTGAVIILAPGESWYEDDAADAAWYAIATAAAQTLNMQTVS